jgi:hypothetical protein
VLPIFCVRPETVSRRVEKATGDVDVFLFLKGRKLQSSTCGVQKMRREDGLKGRLWRGLPWVTVSEQRAEATFGLSSCVRFSSSFKDALSLSPRALACRPATDRLGEGDALESKVGRY